MKSKAIELTEENYYDKDTSWHYMSVSLFKDFMQCEAAALAKLKNEWEPERSPVPLLVGNYVHSYFESEESHQKFVDANSKEMISSRGKTKGQLKADFKVADAMINALKDETVFKALYEPGQKEVIVTGDIYGYKWKGKIDSLNLDQLYFCDLKTVDDIHKKHWSSTYNKYDNFIADRGYYMQMAVYIELIKQTFNTECQPFIFAISKQDPPDKEAIDFNGDQDMLYMQDAMRIIEEQQEHIQKVMSGEEAPTRCNHCEYCRLTKKIELPIHASEIEIY
ncbi:PD-(D/E)XK nuclease-like domain-containing protein [Ligilactobacillus apodemi]|uniref:PD-(D/E)XK nuclease-like domain-containing protein n=1 Tax=Ligilactobacillus apodemi TaxID=307126 RepID=UPI00214AB991|nr:PD-(D/E)XK nuclease-like domain-containing protein [Ligilactobacillus apodemi]MCR1900897.1 PD-(D/E)XK nuclease-like domain-containing protein [Ligilactobacillus apodemi]